LYFNKINFRYCKIALEVHDLIPSSKGGIRRLITVSASEQDFKEFVDFNVFYYLKIPFVQQDLQAGRL
jgi:hypothetical protein